jgi:aldehyde dehydrogenase (NAD+)
VLSVDGLDDALAVHRAVGQHLAASVYTGRPDAVLGDPALLAALGATTVTINDTILPTAHPAASITGTGASGWGPSRGAAGLLALTREVVVSSTSTLLRTPTDEPEERAKRWLRRLALGRPRPQHEAAPGAGADRTDHIAARAAAPKE